jgi:Domain of unknown function (DUF1963)
MTTEEIVRALEPWRARHRRPAWKPIVEEGDGPVTGSKFCGTPWIGPDAPWPACGVCKEPLQLFVQLDLDDLPEVLGQRYGTGLLQLFYCVRDGCQGAGGWEPFADDLSRVRIVRPGATPGQVLVSPLESGYPAKRIVGWEVFLDLPTPSEHDELGLVYTYDFQAGRVRLECPEMGLVFETGLGGDLAEEIGNSELGDKLAGWPAWIQNVEYPSCPRCGRRMVLVFQVDSEDNIPFMFGDCGCGHITQCPEHKDVVAFGWACS